MSTKTTPLERFQSLLHELFQFDCADSNLGISCIMNHTQTVIEHFTTQDLFQAVAKELNGDALRNGHTAVVLWREMKGWKKENYEHDREFVPERSTTEV